MGGRNLALAFLKQKDIDKAFEVTGTKPGYDENHFEADNSILGEIESAYIENEEYAKAIKVKNDDYYRILCLCLEKMQATQSIQKLKSFIDGHLYLFSESDMEKNKERLYEFVGLEYTPSKSSTRAEETEDKPEQTPEEIEQE